MSGDTKERYQYGTFIPWFRTEEDLRRIAKDNPAWTTDQIEAELQLAKLQEAHYNLELQMIDFALEHNLQLTLGEEKNGQRMLITHEDKNDEEYGLNTYKLAGQWLTSSESC